MPQLEDEATQEKIAQEKLKRFCDSLRTLYRQIKQLIGPERANVDKTLAKAARYEQLVKSDVGGSGSVYPAELVEDVKAECLHEINARLIGTGQVVNELIEQNSTVLSNYQELEGASRSLNWQRSGAILLGTEHQKPLEFYLREGFRIVNKMNLLVTRYKHTFKVVEVQQADSIQRFRDCLKLPDELDLCVQEFVSFTVFMLK
ncbi:uncharacterized protein LOC120413510 [Culex pipiens pallens]|uniref:uncharacterized protein LOC120413510 n=1 Tax=Culex pipiens pallens TaxID=42434 RepID=UPI001953534D|nr:uncharacterized protein LOC120413510 [Culex pipiens pallens]